MTDRDGAGRKILGTSSNSDVPLLPPAGRLSSRPLLGRSGGPAPSRAGDSPEPPSGAGTKKKRRRIKVRFVLIAVLALLLLLPLCAFAYGWWQFSKIPTVDVSSVLSPRGSRSATNYLIVGTDSRAGIAANDPNAGAFLSGEVSGSRTDTIMVLHVDGSSTQLASIPRDLWVTDPSTGQKGRINSTFAAGPANLIKAVESLGIPIDQYLEINFVSFGRLVDAVGGITIDFAYPAKDDHSGLSVAKAGPNHLNGSEALAYVRSRYFAELVDGKWRVDGTADIGRTERQRAFLTALMHKVSSDRNPIDLLRLPSSLGAGMKRGSTFSYVDAIDLAWTMKDASPTPVALPVTPRRTSGGADVLELDPESKSVIQGLAG